MDCRHPFCFNLSQGIDDGILEHGQESCRPGIILVSTHCNKCLYLNIQNLFNWLGNAINDHTVFPVDHQHTRGGRSPARETIWMGSSGRCFCNDLINEGRNTVTVNFLVMVGPSSHPVGTVASGYVWFLRRIFPPPAPQHHGLLVFDLVCSHSVIVLSCSRTHPHSKASPAAPSNFNAFNVQQIEPFCSIAIGDMTTLETTGTPARPKPQNVISQGVLEA